MATALPKTLGELLASGINIKSIKDEMRDNLVRKLQNKEHLFPGIIGYDNTVIPQIVHAVLSRHDMIFLGLRGQAKTRIIRQLSSLLDEWIPIVAGSAINDNPFSPITKSAKSLISAKQIETPVTWLHRDERYYEKLATPDVTIADLIGDIDPIKAAKNHLDLSDELAIHYGLVPRANRCIFAINEVPDLSPKIQVGLFNIMQERDVQIRGYSIRMPLDICLVYSANPQDYTNRGRIVTPLKDRIGSEIRTHYPLSRELGMAITMQEVPSTARGGKKVIIPAFLHEIIEEIACSARHSQEVEQESGVSARFSITSMENLISSAERRALINKEPVICPRMSDLIHIIPAMSGKMELSYSGEERGMEYVAKSLIKEAVSTVFSEFFADDPCFLLLSWFGNEGNMVTITDEVSALEVIERARGITGLFEKITNRFPGLDPEAPESFACAIEFVLEGLHCHKKLNKTEKNGEMVFG